VHNFHLSIACGFVYSASAKRGRSVKSLSKVSAILIEMKMTEFSCVISGLSKDITWCFKQSTLDEGDVFVNQLSEVSAILIEMKTTESSSETNALRKGPTCSFIRSAFDKEHRVHQQNPNALEALETLEKQYLLLGTPEMLDFSRELRKFLAAPEDSGEDMASP
jgi:hypothetical protein